MTFATLGLAALLAAGPDTPTPEELTQAIANLSSTDADRQDAGIADAVRWGRDAKSLLPALLALKIERRGETWPRDRFCDALRMIGDPADATASKAIVLRLAEIVADTQAEPWFRDKAATTLFAFTPHLRHALPQLQAVLKSRTKGDGCEYLRFEVVCLLARIGPDAIPDLIAALADPECDCRALIADVLGGLGGTARPAIPTLRHCLTDADAELCSCCTRALSRIEPTNANVLWSWRLLATPAEKLGDELVFQFRSLPRHPSMSSLLSDPFSGELLLDLRDFGAIVEHLDAETDETEAESREWLAKILNRSPEYANALEDTAFLGCLLGDRNELRRLVDDASAYGTRPDLNAQRAFRRFFEWFPSVENRRTRQGSAVALLGVLGPTTSLAWGTLRQVWDERPHARGGQLALAMWRAVPDEIEQHGMPIDGHAEVLRRIREVLDANGRLGDCGSTLVALTAIGPAARPLLPRIEAMLDGPYWREAIVALSGMGPHTYRLVRRLRVIGKHHATNTDRVEMNCAIFRVAHHSENNRVSRLLGPEPTLEDQLEARHLAMLVPGRKPAVLLARPLLLSPDQSTWEAAARFLWKTDPAEAKRLNVPPVLSASPNERPTDKEVTR